MLELFDRFRQLTLLNVDATENKVGGHVIRFELESLLQMLDRRLVLARQVVIGRDIHVDLQRERIQCKRLLVVDSGLFKAAEVAQIRAIPLKRRTDTRI